MKDKLYRGRQFCALLSEEATSLPLSHDESAIEIIVIVFCRCEILKCSSVQKYRDKLIFEFFESLMNPIEI